MRDIVALQIYDLCAKYQVPITIHQDPAEYKSAYEELERAVERSPNCIIILHGWWLDSTHVERLIIRHPNLYVELAGELETDQNEFLGKTRRDQFVERDGKIRQEWRNIFEKYSDRIINGFDLFTQSAYSYEGIKIRVDYSRNLFGQISQKAAERINYRNMENLLAKKIYIINISLSSSSAKAGDLVAISAQLRNMAGSPIRNETVTFFLESSDGGTTSIGDAKTGNSGLAVLNYEVNIRAGTYWVVASHLESTAYSDRNARIQLTITQLTMTTSKSTKTVGSVTPTSPGTASPNYDLYSGVVVTAILALVIGFVVRGRLRKKK